MSIWKLLLILLTCTYLVKGLMLSHKQLSRIWRPTEYLEDMSSGAEALKSKVYSKQDWIKQYQEQFDVPEWLALQKYNECDFNKDGKITGNETVCF